jgi:hypothetical protein
MNLKDQLPQKQFKSTLGPMYAVNLENLKQKIREMVKEKLKEYSNLPSSNSFSNEVEKIADSIWGGVYSAKLAKDTGTDLIYIIRLHSESGPVKILKKDVNNEWFYVSDDRKKWVPIDKSNLKEISTTGGVAGYMTPYAFSRNKKGSPKAIQSSEKLGFKVVKNIDEEKGEE